MSMEKLFHREPALAMAAVPRQSWTAPVDPKLGLKQGTIFKELNLPFYVGGDRYGR